MTDSFQKILSKTFGEANITFLELRRVMYVIAFEIGRALAYADDGRSFVVSLGRWAASGKIRSGDHYLTLEGKDLADMKQLISDSLISPHTRSLLLLTERGLYRALMLAGGPNAATFNDWLDGDVLPAIRATGGYSLAGGAREIPGPTPPAPLDPKSRRIEAVLELVRDGRSTADILALIGRATDEAPTRDTRTQLERRQAVLALLQDPAWCESSSRAIANEARVSHTYVDKLRRFYDVQAGELLPNAVIERVNRERGTNGPEPLEAGDDPAPDTARALAIRPGPWTPPPLAREHYATVKPLRIELVKDDPGLRALAAWVHETPGRWRATTANREIPVPDGGWLGAWRNGATIRPGLAFVADVARARLLTTVYGTTTEMQEAFTFWRERRWLYVLKDRSGNTIALPVGEEKWRVYLIADAVTRELGLSPGT